MSWLWIDFLTTRSRGRSQHFFLHLLGEKSNKIPRLFGKWILFLWAFLLSASLFQFINWSYQKFFTFSKKFSMNWLRKACRFVQVRGNLNWAKWLNKCKWNWVYSACPRLAFNLKTFFLFLYGNKVKKLLTSNANYANWTTRIFWEF